MQWFVDDTSKYFSDSLQVLNLVIKSVTELGKITVDSNGNYYTNGADMSWLRDVNKVEITTEGNAEKVFMSQYGFTAKEARVISLAQDAYLKKSKSINEHAYLAMSATLCDRYRATRWAITAGTGTKKAAENFFKKLGLTDKEIEELYNAVNDQHNRVSKKDAPITDQKRDYAHEMVALAIFTNPSVIEATSNPIITPRGWLNIIMGGQLNEFSSYKGDITSNRFGLEDKQSDTDANNIYHRSINNGSGVIFNFDEYNKQLNNGEINRAEEFLKTLGNGDIEDGKKELKHQVNLYTAGDEYMAGMPTLKKAKSFFSNILDSKQHKKECMKIDESVDEYETQKNTFLQEYLDYLEEELAK